MDLKIGSHVGMSGKDMFAGSVKEALSYGANTFMVYTGAPQNTRRKSIEELNIELSNESVLKVEKYDDIYQIYANDKVCNVKYLILANEHWKINIFGKKAM